MNEIKSKLIKLQELLEVSKLLNSSMNINEILKLLLKKSLELIEGGDAGMISLYNPENGMLEIKAYEGVGDCIRTLKFLPGESFAGRAFSDKRTYFYSNAADVKHAMSTLSSDNLKILMKSVENTVNSIDIYGGIGCPLMYQQECIGVIVIDNFYNNAPLTQDDVEILEMISVQATIAIVNARNYEREQRHNRIMEYSSSLHSRFTEMVLGGSGVNDIVSEISTRLGRDVFMIDLFGNMEQSSLNHYGTIENILGNSRERLMKLLSAQKLNHFSTDIGLHLYISPIIVNKEILGWLCAVSEGDEYSELDYITIERGITILALELLKINDLNNMEQSLKGDFLDSLILNQDREYLLRCAKNYKFNLEKNHRMIILEFKSRNVLEEVNAGNVELSRYIRHCYEILVKNAQKTMPNSMPLIKGSNIIIIVEEDANTKNEIKYLLDTIMNTECRMLQLHDNINIFGGVSGIIHDVDEFNPSYFNTQQIIRMLEGSSDENGYMFYEELEIKKLLLGNRREDLEQFLYNVLGPLIEYPGDSKEYLKTLKTYIQSNGNWTYTKDTLHIHGNTLSYRIRRIGEILGADLAEYNEKFKIQIALAIYEIFYSFD